MESWILYVFIAQVIWAICCIIDKVVVSRGHIRNPLVYIMVNAIMNVFLIFLVPFIHIEKLSLFDTIIAILSGFVLSSGVALYYKAVQYDEVSRVRMMDQAGPVMILLLSFLFLGERLSGKQIIGFLFLLAAGIIASLHSMKGKIKFSKAYALILCSTLFGVIGALCAKHIYSATTFWNAFFWLRLGQFSTIFVLILPKIRKDFIKTYREMKPQGKKIIGFKMIIDFSAFILSGLAILNGPVSLVWTLSSALGPILVFIFATIVSAYLPFIIKEDIDKKALFYKAISAVFIVAGILFINS